MKKLNQDYPLSKVVNMLETNIGTEMIGAIVRFKRSALKNRGTQARDNTFEIGGTQKVWGYDENGKYTIIDGFRLFPITCFDDFGCPASLADLDIIEMPKK